MGRIMLQLLAVAVAASRFTGCNPMSTATSTSYATQDLTGNLQVSISDPPYPGPYPISSFTGALSGQGQNITAILRAPGTGCVSSTFDIAFAGSQAADGSLVLTSTNLPNNVATISTVANGIMPFTNGGAQFLGGLLITGSGPCTMGSIVLRGEEFAPLTGTYVGSITSTAGASANFSTTFAQASANSDGQFPESGTITVTGSNCTNGFSVTGTIAGPALTAVLTPVSGPSATATLVTGPTYGATALFLTMNIVSTGCNNGIFTGSLTKQ
jgi:hypothetical protein